MTAKLEGKDFIGFSDSIIRILVVNDNQIENEFMSIYFGNQTTQVVIAECGEQALLELEATHFDIILLNSDLPDMKGVEFAEIFKSEFGLSKIPTIMIMPDGDRSTNTAAYIIGVDFCHAKPIEWRLLTHQMKELLHVSCQRASARVTHAER